MGKMRKRTSIQIQSKAVPLLLALFLSMLFTIYTSEANTETIVKVEPPIIFAKMGDTATINITVYNVTNLYGVEITLYWNASILKMLDADIRLGIENYPDGILHNLTDANISIYSNEIFQEQGKYVLAASSTSPAPSFNGSGNIVIVTFNVTDVGSCELGLETKFTSNIIPPGSTHVALIPHITLSGFFGPIQITATPKAVTVGENVNINGLISQAQADIPVIILCRSTEDIEWQPLTTVNTTKKGSYTYIWNPLKKGTYHLKAKATILGHIEESPIVQIIVKEPECPTWPYIVTFTLAFIVIITATAFLLYRKRTRRKRKECQR